MAGTTTNGAIELRPSRRRRGCVIPLIVLVGWLVIGALRGPVIARDYFTGAHGAGATVTNVEIHGSIPLIPPFWGVSIQGDVREPQMTGPGYISAMLLCIEPITGWVIVCGAG